MRKREDGKVENTYTTMLCAIVGMGYQCQSFLCDSWSHGNCQSRTRLILAITKEGTCVLPTPAIGVPQFLLKPSGRSGHLRKLPAIDEQEFYGEVMN